MMKNTWARKSNEFKFRYLTAFQLLQHDNLIASKSVNSFFLNVNHVLFLKQNFKYEI